MIRKKSKSGLVIYGALAAIAMTVHILIDLKIFSFSQEDVRLIKNLSISLFLAFVILFLHRLITQIIISREHSKGEEYNLLMVIDLLSILGIVIVCIAFIFQNLYAAVVSFGLISLVLGFALQVPISSFIAWLYVIFRRPFKVGDRIQVGDQKGDVIEISFLDTVMLEVSGDYLGNDRLSGRKIHFPNIVILQDKVINYSGPQKPFIWDETPLQIAYTSDLKFVEESLIIACKKDFAEHYPKLKDIDRWKPEVYFRVNKFAWLEAVISYPVDPRDTTGRRNRILRYALPMLNEEPTKVQFPEGTKR